MAILHLEMVEGDTVQIGDAVVILEKKNGKRARFKIDADRSVKVELFKDPLRRVGNSVDSRMSAAEKGKHSWQEPSLG